jgi:hypothetical protein
MSLFARVGVFKHRGSNYLNICPNLKKFDLHEITRCTRSIKMGLNNGAYMVA